MASVVPSFDWIICSSSEDDQRTEQTRVYVSTQMRGERMAGRRAVFARHVSRPHVCVR